MAEKALLVKAYIQGVSTRSVDDLVQAMGMSGIPRARSGCAARSTIRSTASSIDRWRATGPICGSTPYVKREAGRIVSVAVTVAVAVNDQGRREVLGMAIGASEAEAFWTEFLRSLARRGLRGVT